MENLLLACNKTDHPSPFIQQSCVGGGEKVWWLHFGARGLGFSSACLALLSICSASDQRKPFCDVQLSIEIYNSHLGAESGLVIAVVMN